MLSCARLTFRPLTPTQYHHEGIKSKKLVSGAHVLSKAHSPVPIFLLFDSKDVLTRADSRFSEYGLGKVGTTLLSTASELRHLPWKDIYATGPIPDADKNNKISRRNAEVVVPEKIDLGSLSRIHCRSVAEKETLLYLLPEPYRSTFTPIVTATAKDYLFNRKRTFVQSVVMTEQGLRFHFSPETECPGPYDVKLKLRTLPDLREAIFEERVHELNHSYTHIFKKSAQNYEAELFLDDLLAFASRFEPRPLIF